MSKDTETAADKATKAAAKADKNVVAGPAIAEKTVFDQAKEARKDEDKTDDSDGGKVHSGALAAAKEAMTPEMKLRDEAKKARVEHLESLGLDPENPEAGMHKVEEGTGGKLYKGIVTVTSVSGEYDNSKISTRIDIGSQPRGEGWLKYAFKQHFPSADVEKSFEVDETNKADPLLRTKFD